MAVQQFLLGALVLAADRLGKSVVACRLGVGESVAIGSALRVRHVVTRVRDRRDRRGIRWTVQLGVFGGAALAAIVCAIRSGWFFGRPVAQMGLAAAVAGAASNYYDFWRRGAVIDFLDLGWWPVFNIADAAITCGVITALCFM